MSGTVERRRYFRVQDSIELAYRILAPNEDIDDKLRLEQVWSGRQAALEKRIQAIQERVQRSFPEVAELFDLLNEKVNLLAASEAQASLEIDQAPREQAVNISACGIAFFAAESIPLASRVLLHLRVQPDSQLLSIIGTVIAIETDHDQEAPHNVLIRADFTDIKEDHQELLIQHVIQCQNRELRRRREARDSDSNSNS